MRVLLKLPTRSRPAQFFAVLNKYLFYAEDKENLKVIVSIDSDDPSMNVDLPLYENVTFVMGESRNKIHAINRDIPEEGWDILVVASDDMVPEPGWDTAVRAAMQANFPDTDGCLWFFDGFAKTICTMPILGHKYCKRFAWEDVPYNHLYISLWADNEQTEVGELLGRMYKSDQIIARHIHPSNVQGVEVDDLYRRNEGYVGRDKLTYVTRKIAGYGLMPQVQKPKSQNNEEQLIQEYFGKSKGCVLDIGANDGVTLSNSYACIERGWEALLVEPSPKAFDKLLVTHASRIASKQVLAIQAAISSETQEDVEFFESGTHLNKGDVSLVSTLKQDEMVKWSTSSKFDGIRVKTMTFRDLCDLVVRDNYPILDLITIDAEGMDYEILKQIDLSAVNCKMLIIEHRDNVPEILEYCKRFGLSLTSRNSENLILCK